MLRVAFSRESSTIPRHFEWTRETTMTNHSHSQRKVTADHKTYLSGQNRGHRGSGQDQKGFVTNDHLEAFEETGFTGWNDV